MTKNIYLEKIAGILSATEQFFTPLKKYVSRQVNLSTGGAYRSYAARHLGVTDPAILSKIGTGAEGQRIFNNAYKASSKFLPKPEYMKKTRAFLQDKKDLQSLTTNARIQVGGMAVGGLYVANKIGNSLTNQNNSNNYGY